VATVGLCVIVDVICRVWKM